MNNATDRVFSIGNGSDDSNRSNALTIFKSGLMNINDAYNMPLTDGTANQIMATDGADNVSFVNASTLFTDTNTTYDGTDFTLSNQSLPAGQFVTGVNAAGTLIGAIPNDNDNQNIQGSGLSGTNLTIAIEGGTSEVVDLSSLNSNDADWYETSTTTPSNDINNNIYTLGRVGIGGNPDTDLHLYHDDTAASAGLKIQNQGANNNWWRMFSSNATGNLFIYSTSGGAAPRGNFNNVTGVYSATSDRRLKKDFKPLPFSWKNFMNLETLSYLYKTQTDDKHSLGLIAQDVEQIYPELVTYITESDVYHMNYSGFGVTAIKAIKKLKQEVNILKEENAILKVKLNKLEQLKARLLTLENNTKEKRVIDN
ncbi:tail fiber domain-containing protein [Winogradskyella sp. PG-2]|uniref:tail fiber domain-containing protein n=1 Tax=Winogradskyella sp. PG-2 TaxID=754409 RepID=UPI0004588DAE|nr:tail fiber domain-containing protein [Winogradskyella sp. PG-2]BAO75165.1 putative YapH protein [Winogradskyella sp. PG-2]